MRNLKILGFVLTSYVLSIGMDSFKLLGQTEINQEDVSGVWAFYGSPYMINVDIEVPDGQTLIIDPGVEVIFTQQKKFIIKGQLLAIGKEDSIITFTAMDTTTGWSGMQFLDIPETNDSSKMISCKVEFGIHDELITGEKDAGGIFIRNTDKVLIKFCEITKNKSISDLGSGGGGMAIGNCSPIITQNLFSFNQAIGGHGGGLAVVNNANPMVSNNIFINNSADGGGAIVVSECNPVFINNTILQNHADHGGAVDIIRGSPTFMNTIFYNNTASFGNEIHFFEEFGANFLNCDLAGGKKAFSQNFENGCPDCNGIYESNIASDPQTMGFLNDFNLDDSSPCIGAGIQQVEIGESIYNAPSVDFYGNSRPNPTGSPPDIGAVESELALSTGIGSLEDQQGFKFIENYPNPVINHTRISYYLNHAGTISIEVFDLLGQPISSLTNTYYPAGEHMLNWNVEGIADGIYLCVLKMHGAIDSRKIIIQR